LLEADPEPAPEGPPPLLHAAQVEFVVEPRLPPPRPIGFQNGQAVRVALLAGVLSIIIFAVGGQLAPPAFGPVWLVVSGMLTAFLYKMRTGDKLSAIGGARLGWLSGIFGFVIVACMMGLIAAAVLNDPAALSSLREQWTQSGRAKTDLDNLLSALHHPANLMIAVPASFLLFTVLSAFGGAIGARLLDRD
jgi:pheromone shutdown protein TraB